jgi:hypothetical protein
MITKALEKQIRSDYNHFIVRYFGDREKQVEETWNIWKNKISREEFDKIIKETK